MTILNSVPKFGDKGQDVKELQAALKGKGFNPGSVDGDFGPKTKAALQAFQKSKGLAGTGVIPENGGKTFEYLELKLEKKKESKKSGIPWFWKTKEFSGKGEHDPAFVKYQSGFWGKVGLPQFKTIIGSAFAWCGLGAATGLILVGLNWQKDGAAAKNWDKFGVGIEWRMNGIPQGAFVRINGNGDCKSAKGNHITQANGDCAPSSLGKGATFDGYGANQGNKWKVSTYAVSKICSVRWPADAAFPPPVKVSKNCTSGKSGNESTR